MMCVMQGFWLKEKLTYEQPYVFFTKDFIVRGLDSSGSPLIQYSTLEQYNAVIGYNTVSKAQPSVKSWYVDSNLDSRPDDWHIELSIPLASSSVVTSMDLILFFSVGLQDTVSLSMSSMVHLSKDAGRNGRKWEAMGDVMLKQRNPLLTKGTRTVYNSPLLNASNIVTLSDTDLSHIVRANHMRNESLQYVHESIWSYSAAAEFNVSVWLRVPNAPVIYTPGPAEAIKQAFIQWLAMFWMLYFFMYYIRDFVFKQQIVETLVIHDHVAVEKQHQF